MVIGHLGLASLGRRVASAGLAALVSVVALAIAIPIAHAHLTGGGGAILHASPPADGDTAASFPDCVLCLAAGHASAALPTATALLPTREIAARTPTPPTPAPRATLRRDPASPRAPPA